MATGSCLSTFPNLTLATQRLTLRPFDGRDVPAVAVACADDVTQRWLPLPRPYDAETAARWCTGIAENLRVTGDGIQLAVADRNSDRVVTGARVDPPGGTDRRDRQSRLATRRRKGRVPLRGVARSGGYVHGGRVDLRIYSLIRADMGDRY